MRKVSLGRSGLEVSRLGFGCMGLAEFYGDALSDAEAEKVLAGALDVGATEINEEMKIACVHAIAELARAPSTAEAAAAYEGEQLVFGPDYLIPKPFDPRLLSVVATAVAETAMKTGIAARPLDVDVIWIYGYGFPVYRGGVLFWADSVGLKTIYDKVSQIHQETGSDTWKPAALRYTRSRCRTTTSPAAAVRASPWLCSMCTCVICGAS